MSLAAPFRGLARAARQLPPRAHRLAVGASSLVDRVAPGSPGPVARAWAVAKLATGAACAPVAIPSLVATAARNTRALQDVVEDYGEMVAAAIEGAIEGEGVPLGGTRVLRRPANGRWFISSDLHRGPEGHLDLPRRQGTKRLYAEVLRHYAGRGWGVVENGDAEDLWLVGGSTYGVLYELARLAGELSLRLGAPELAIEVHRLHLERTVENNREVYDLLGDLSRVGRYVRLSGNHDDGFATDWGGHLLEEHLPGLSFADYLVFEGPGGEVTGVVTHGHHPDAWNAPGRSTLGRFATSLACAVYDAPILRAWPGIAEPAETRALLEGRYEDELVRVSPVLGANRQLYTTDEVRLRAAWSRAWAGEEPFLIWGHTHAPRADALDGSGTPWPRYLNGGSGVGAGLVTGVEWEGGEDEPRVRLVAWAPGHDAPERVVLVRSQGASTLGPAPPARLDPTVLERARQEPGASRPDR